MVQDAEARTGPVWAEADDPRITRVGKLLRKSRLDELPQLLNALKGEMSFVGFRPIRRHFAQVLAEQIPYYALRFTIKPGITGWPQVKYNYAGSEGGQLEKFQYELFYLQHASPLLDAYIILKTVQTVLLRRGQ
jgi:lipopolysaccharide/colanic/teichoic acid biosynthesis glycosyltransferase